MAVAQARRTHCPKGHEYTPENTYVTKDRRRICRACSMQRWVDKHPRPGLVERFWRLIRKDDSGCWLWQGSIGNTGYGWFSRGRRHTRMLAHRYSYELLVGPIPEGLVIDHLCRVRTCVNPSHLEVVTIAENVRRGVMWRTKEVMP